MSTGTGSPREIESSGRITGSTRSRTRAESSGDCGRNLVIAEGSVRVAPTERPLSDGTILVTFDVVTRIDGARTSLPVSWVGPAAAMPKLTAGAPVAVLGTVQRRFFRAGGTTASAVDVRATHVARTPVARRKVVAAARALLELDSAT